MSLIEWRKEFCTGVPGVDYEHQELVKQVNAIYALIDEEAEKDKVIDSLGDIYGSISAHFALEEQLMEKHGYDHFRQHQADHERLLDEIRDITEEYETAERLDKDRFTQKLNDWFSVHFKTHDSRLHNLANLIEHQHVNDSVMKNLIRNAKNTLLGRTG